MTMRVRKFHILLCLALCGNFVLIVYIANLPADICGNDSLPKLIHDDIEREVNRRADDSRKFVGLDESSVTSLQKLSTSISPASIVTTGADGNIENLVTIIIREFEDFDNDVSNMISLIRSVHPNISIVVVCDTYPYPALDIKHKNVRFYRLRFSPTDDISRTNAARYIQTEYSLLLADTSVMLSNLFLKELVSEHRISGNTSNLIAVKVGINPWNCQHVKFDVKRWTLEFSNVEQKNWCSSVAKQHTILIRTDQLLDLPYPFLRPFPDAMFVQTSLRGWKIVFSERKLTQSRLLFTNPQHQWKHKTLNRQRWESVYRTLGIKKVVKSDGAVEWYGCSKSSSRCFGSVIRDVPEYLYQNRWTPPCCLKHLRELAKHVFSNLEKDDVRYWLEGGSLLGAVRNNDIIPWDYDIDIGIYKEDVNKSDMLFAAMSSPTDDSRGCIWEKAHKGEGDFFRIQYSDTNHLHVDVFPFYSRNGTMTKDTWFKTHRQDTEFPEKYLKPLEKMKFAGIMVSVPNNAVEFLEFKFGKGVVENPQYPKPVIIP